MSIDVQTLTTYNIDDDGRTVAVGLMDTAGNQTTPNLQISELGVLAMTLPSLIEPALRRQYRDASLRYTHPIGSWHVEAASDPSSLIVTMRTPDGYGVSFAMSRAKAEELGESIRSASSAPHMCGITAH